MEWAHNTDESREHHQVQPKALPSPVCTIQDQTPLDSFDPVPLLSSILMRRATAFCPTMYRPINVVGGMLPSKLKPDADRDRDGCNTNGRNRFDPVWAV